MKRRRAAGVAVLWSAAIAAGCGGASSDPCAGKGEICVGLKLTGSVGELDRIGVEVALPDMKRVRAETMTLKPAARLPVQVPIILPKGTSGRVELGVTGWFGAEARGYGTGGLTVPPSGQRLTIELRPGGPPPAGDAGAGAAGRDTGPVPASDGGGALTDAAGGPPDGPRETGAAPDARASDDSRAADSASADVPPTSVDAAGTAADVGAQPDAASAADDVAAPVPDAAPPPDAELPDVGAPPPDAAEIDAPVPLPDAPIAADAPEPPPPDAPEFDAPAAPDAPEPEAPPPVDTEPPVLVDAAVDAMPDAEVDAAPPPVDAAKPAPDFGCQPGMCPPLMIGDLTDMNLSTAPGFDATGFRCKTLSVCGANASCIYFAADTLGHKQSAEATYYDGAEMTPVAAKLQLDVGAASQCGNPAVTFTASDYITLTFDGGQQLAVYLPAFSGTSLTLYIASDGSTFYNAGLTMVARLRP